MSDGFFHRYFLNNAHKRLHKWVHYFDIYEKHLVRLRNKPTVMLEIGVKGGGSLALWKAYLGPSAKIIGIDINPECKAHEDENIEIFIGSQDDPELIKKITDKYPNIDVVLDDGSHMMKHMINSFRMLYDFVNPHGVYMIEDTHTSYWDEFDGGLKRSGSIMEFTKDLLDELNAKHTKGLLKTSTFTRSTHSVCVYDSMIVFEKMPQGARQAIVTQPMT